MRIKTITKASSAQTLSAESEAFTHAQVLEQFAS
jgi:hypothetical protein